MSIGVILKIVGSVVGMIATWYISKIFLKWFQSYENHKEVKRSEEDRKTSQQENQDANRESDRLKEIDGR